ncbi:MAG: class I SAM-dependent methyltransferase [Pirellulaceae bacterium]|nr:class I SAM-dependent methyltransferase [Pirellulaceae bacterium]
MIKFDADAITISMLDDMDLRPGMLVLDVGCGYGSVSRMVAERVGPNGRVTAMDREMSHLAQAEELTIESGLRNIDYVRGDLTSFEFASESYDAIVGRRVLMYVPDAKHVLRRLACLLKTGGILAFQEHVNH